MADSNLYFGLGKFEATRGIDDLHPINADPMLRSPSKLEFSLRAASPAIDAGTAPRERFLRRDFASWTRPHGVAPDIGAFEYAPGR